MIYTFFMKKFEKDKAPFPTTMVVKKYLESYGKKDIVVSFPGYMGKTVITIEDFIKGMDFPSKTYFTTGMNGCEDCQCSKKGGAPHLCRKNRKRTCLCTNHNSKSCIYGMKIQEYHNKHFNMLANINSTLKDHSKMLFFLDPTSVNEKLFDQNTEIIELTEAHSLLMGCKVKAVLIGSSNQSYNTYFKDPADKGEADVFMINSSVLLQQDKDKMDEEIQDKDKMDEEIMNFYNRIVAESDTKENQEDHLSRRIVLSKQMIGGGDDFLGEIFRRSII